MLTTLSTDRVRPAERAGYWSDIVSRSFGRLRSSTYGDDRFTGQVSQVALGDVRVSRLEATPHRVVRTAGITGQSDPGYLKMVVQHRGYSLFEQNGRRALVGPGSWSLYDTTRSYTVDSPAPVTLDVLLLPRHALIGGRPELADLLVRQLPAGTGLGRVACERIRSVVEQALAAPAGISDPAVLGESIIRLVRIALLESAGDARALSQRWITRERVKEYVERRLGEPGLDAETIARALNCSKRTLHYAFEDEQTSLHQHIWGLRLEAARRDIESRQGNRSITDIAFARGFSSAAHFSRAFRARYGASPSQWQARDR